MKRGDFMNTTNSQILINYITSKVTPLRQEQTKFDLKIILEEKDGIVCQVIFWKNNVIECRIEDENVNYYYLHFEYESFSQSTKLIDDFLSFKEDFFNNEATHVLVCCSGGFTSSLLVDGLNRIIKEMNYRMTVEFGSCYKADLNNANYDLILLAPQIGHLKTQLKTTIPIDIIPTNIYGASNYHALLTFILNHI